MEKEESVVISRCIQRLRYLTNDLFESQKLLVQTCREETNTGGVEILVDYSDIIQQIKEQWEEVNEARLELRQGLHTYSEGVESRILKSSRKNPLIDDVEVKGGSSRGTGSSIEDLKQMLEIQEGVLTKLGNWKAKNLGALDSYQSDLEAYQQLLNSDSGGV